MTTKTRKLTESAMLIAVAVALEAVSKALIPGMPFGGQITICSMLPVVLIAYRHGTPWGLLAAFAYSLLQMALGADHVAAAFQPDYFGEGTKIANAIFMCLMDYVLAFTALGLGGIFRNRIKNEGLALCLGVVVALFARYVCHVLSGYILFAGYAEWFFTQDGFPAWGMTLVNTLDAKTLGFVYSAVYNGYMFIEMAITAVAAFFLAKVPEITGKKTPV